MKHLRYAERALRYPTAALMAYETVALCYPGHRVPAITDITSKHRWLIPLAAGLTAWHLAAWPSPVEPV